MNAPRADDDDEQEEVPSEEAEEREQRLQSIRECIAPGDLQRAFDLGWKGPDSAEKAAAQPSSSTEPVDASLSGVDESSIAASSEFWQAISPKQSPRRPPRPTWDDPKTKSSLWF